MDHREVRRHWDSDAHTWTKLVRAGYDVYRDQFNTPAFLEMLPDVKGLHGLDIGCGEGCNTRHLAARGATMSAVDVSRVFVSHATNGEETVLHAPDYLVGSAVDLPFGAETFEFATGFMSFMDIPETDMVISEAYRVLKPGGFLQFSISHPCFDTRHRRNLRDEQGQTYAFEIGGYFDSLEGEVMEWMFSAVPADMREDLPVFRTPRFTHTLSYWFNMLLGAGFAIECIGEPSPSDEVVSRYPTIQDAQVVAYFLHIRARKERER